MGLREDAIAAAEAAATQRVTYARAVLASTLDPADVTGLDVADSDDKLVVFTDGADLCIGVRDGATPPRVSLVTDQDGWTARGDVTSLTTLGRLLAAENSGA